MSTTSLMTFAEFEQLPEMPGKQELIDGELITMPPPDNRHSVASKRVFRHFLASLTEDRVWGDHTGYRVAGGWLEPDASISWPDQAKDDKYLLRAPMLAVEILSQGEEIERKLTLYFEEGALEVWVIDVKHKTMTVYLRRGSEVIRQAVDREYKSEAVEVSVSLPELFA